MTKVTAVAFGQFSFSTQCASLVWTWPPTLVRAPFSSAIARGNRLFAPIACADGSRLKVWQALYKRCKRREKSPESSDPHWPYALAGGVLPPLVIIAFPAALGRSDTKPGVAFGGLLAPGVSSPQTCDSRSASFMGDPEHTHEPRFVRSPAENVSNQGVRARAVGLHS